MIETKLTDLLDRRADQTSVGPPPLVALRAGATRRRRRRAAGLSAVAAAAVATVVGGATLLASHGPTAPVTSPAPVPFATRLVGFGHAAIAVPKAWGTNVSNCGTPMADTVLVDDPSAFHFCMGLRPSGVESVQLGYGRVQAGFHSDETFEIDGVRAERQGTTCSTYSYFRSNTTICVGTVFIPSLQVWFRAESSTSADEVARILDRIAIVTDQSGVPGYRTVGGTAQGPLAAKYAPLLEKAGLKARYVMKKSPNYPAGLVFGVSPAPGTMLKAGATVTVTVTS
jgi:hypothetical protein